MMFFVVSSSMRFRSGIPFHLWNLGLRIFDETVGRLFPLDWSRTVVTVCQQRDDVAAVADSQT